MHCIFLQRSYFVFFQEGLFKQKKLPTNMILSDLEGIFSKHFLANNHENSVMCRRT